MNSRDRYEIMKLCEIPHFIKQPCNSVYLKKGLESIEIAEKILYSVYAYFIKLYNFISIPTIHYYCTSMNDTMHLYI